MTRLLIVDPNRTTPTAVTALEAQPDIQLVGVVQTAEAALAQIDECDMIMIDAGLPRGGALELVRAVVNLDPWVRILVTNLAGAQAPSASYIEAGAAGWVL